LKIIVQNKQQELDASAMDVSKALVAVTMQQIIKEEDDTAGTAAPSTPETEAHMPLVQWAAGFAMALSPSARQAFEQWLSAQPAPAATAGSGRSLRSSSAWPSFVMHGWQTKLGKQK